MSRRLAILCLGICWGPGAFAIAPAKPSAAQRPQRCAISIRMEKRTGVENLSFRTALRNENECRTLAQMHEKNFAPNEVLTKKVSYSWLGRSTPKVLAKHHRKHRDHSLVRR